MTWVGGHSGPSWNPTHCCLMR